jgi:hypothetical protein
VPAGHILEWSTEENVIVGTASEREVSRLWIRTARFRAPGIASSIVGRGIG